MARPAPLPLEFRVRPFHVGQAAVHGVTASRLRARDLVRPYRGVRATSVPATVLERCQAYATRMPSEHWFSHATAAQLWALPLPGGSSETVGCMSARRAASPRWRV
ncbi:hypothetical protein ACFQ58_06180 [Agromyces sp. NPDC056523]|uniref:hypothetical protein n=1 Tax=Agromyces sp. NPDC056523 TaxID=3345850 RepID=UPI00366EA172